MLALNFTHYQCFYLFVCVCVCVCMCVCMCVHSMCVCMCCVTLLFDNIDLLVGVLSISTTRYPDLWAARAAPPQMSELLPVQPGTSRSQVVFQDSVAPLITLVLLR